METADCEHAWLPVYAEQAGPGLGLWWRCERCSAEAYEPSITDSGDRRYPDE